MQHLHFQTIPSTQIYLRDHRLDFTEREVLISCSEQSSGIGRTGNVWDFYPESLAMSFLITPNITPTLTTIELGILARQFFKQKFNLEIYLKWPNDLMTKDAKKCGGIIAHYIDTNTIIAGLGINLSKPSQHYTYPVAHITLEKDFNNKELSFQIYKFILENRIQDAEKIIEIFKANCIHTNQVVNIIEGDITYSGIFSGINNLGEAILEINGMKKNFLSGTLNLN
jgi:BirA family biotin operon repressor/biotin-[acetyl-CoA-carboxylase] ligase